MKKKSRGTPCLICQTPPQAGWGFCHTCYTRLRYRVYKVMKDQQITDPLEKKELMVASMRKFGIAAKAGKITQIAAHSSNLITSCMKCMKPGKKVVSRGLCNTCFVYYKRKVKKGATSWEELELKKLSRPKLY